MSRSTPNTVNWFTGLAEIPLTRRRTYKPSCLRNGISSINTGFQDTQSAVSIMTQCLIRMEYRLLACPMLSDVSDSLCSLLLHLNMQKR